MSAENFIKFWNTRVNFHQVYGYPGRLTSPLYLDWPLYPIPRETFGNDNLSCVAFRRVGIYIRWLGSQDCTLGVLVFFYINISGSMSWLLTFLLALRMQMGRFMTTGVKPRFA